MIRIVLIDGINCPNFVCDCCRDMIDNGVDGSYGFVKGPDGPATGIAYTVHNQCVDKFVAEFDRRYKWVWLDLYALPIFLSNNLLKLGTKRCGRS